MDTTRQTIIDEASEHPYTCKCEKCKIWWDSMPPEEDGDDMDDDDAPAF